ncbi:MAG: hypothetical protein ACD_75C02503G0002 [uncultured bacterium]|nr:MAG: hypothetical protein ACD_75C02503G0002 [uncultured bacterium]
MNAGDRRRFRRGFNDTRERDDRMTSVQNHYDRLLGPLYGWMLGDGEKARERARQELHDAGISAGDGLAVDLGAGNGLHAVPLAESGYAVVAIDTCQSLLDELRESSGTFAITAVRDSLETFRRHCPTAPDVVVCMGDTLTHLPSREAVQGLISEVAASLAPGGIFVTTFRDYVRGVLEGPARFIPVQSDEEKILTCFLEYGRDRVIVHDILHTRALSGWEMTVSAYPKVRLDPEWVGAQLGQRGLQVCTEPGQRGMVRIVARKI